MLRTEDPHRWAAELDVFLDCKFSVTSGRHYSGNCGALELAMEIGRAVARFCSRLEREISSQVPTILIAEPNPGLRHLEWQALARDYRVMRTSGAEEAIRTAARHEVEVDLLLTEVYLPNLQGWDLTELLHLDYPNCKVVYLASSITPAMKARARSATVLLMDERRFSPVRLYRAVQEALALQTPALSKRMLHRLGSLWLRWRQAVSIRGV